MLFFVATDLSPRTKHWYTWALWTVMCRIAPSKFARPLIDMAPEISDAVTSIAKCSEKVAMGEATHHFRPPKDLASMGFNIYETHYHALA